VGHSLRKRLCITRKRLTRIAKNKFTPLNAARYFFYTRALMPALNKDACVWVDETGISVLEAQRTHGRCAPACFAVRRLASALTAEAGHAHAGRTRGRRQ